MLPPRDALPWSEGRLRAWLKSGYDAVLLSLQSVVVLVFAKGKAYCTVDLNALKERNVPFFEEVVQMRVCNGDRDQT